MKAKRYNIFTEDKLLYLSQMIISAYFNDELILIVIHGKQGFGKSSYASMVVAQVHGYVKGKETNPDATEFEYDWKAAKEYLIFTPRQFLTLSRTRKRKAPVSVVDDAGLWLNAMDFHHPLVKATGKFLEVARTKWGAIIFTCSDLKQIFTKIRNMPHVYTVRITKFKTDKTHRDRRSATIFEGWVSEDLKKSGRKTRFIDIFYAHMPDKYYEWYRPERAKLTDTGLDELELELNKLGI